MKVKDGLNSMKHKVLHRRMEIKSVNEDGVFSGYASVFGNVDLGGDIVERGAFSRADMELTKDGMIRICDHHSLRSIIGKASVEQDDVGLAFEGQLLLGLAAAREAHIKMKAHVLDGMSIGYESLEDEMMNSGVRKLKRLKLMEISVVTFGMNPLARIEAVKERARQCTNIREYESLLREECGFSNSQAKLLASGGWKALQQARDESGAEEGDAALDGLLSYVKSISSSSNP